MYFYLLRLFNFCLLNLFIYVVLPYIYDGEMKLYIKECGAVSETWVDQYRETGNGRRRKKNGIDIDRM